VGGFEALTGRWPWQAALLTELAPSVFTHSCGAALIGRQWLLTAVGIFQVAIGHLLDQTKYIARGR